MKAASLKRQACPATSGRNREACSTGLAAAGALAVRRQRRAARPALPGVRRPRREGARASAQAFRLCRARHRAPCGDGPSHRARALPRQPRRRDDRRLRDHARRRRERAAAGCSPMSMTLLDAPGAEYYLEHRIVFPDHCRAPSARPTSSSASAPPCMSSTSSSAPACASWRCTLTATRTSSTRSCCFTPRRRGTRLPAILRRRR